MLTKFEFDVEALRCGEDLFPAFIADDPWIAYHGTSGRNESSVEQDGLKGGIARLIRTELEAVGESLRCDVLAGRVS